VDSPDFDTQTHFPTAVSMARIRYKKIWSFKQSPIPRGVKERVGHRQGQLIRKIAQRSIRNPGKKGRPSKPGNPPKNREGQLRYFIFYSWDDMSQGVIVGPEKLPGAKQDTPAALEGTRRRRRLRPRPYMRPALEKAQSKLPELWRGAIRTGPGMTFDRGPLLER
jgi:hypothetical protein